MRLWELCLSRSPDYGVTAFKDTSELDQRSRRDGTQEHLRAQMSKTVWFGKIKDPEKIVLNFRGQLQCRMGGKRQVPIEFYPKFWILNPCWRGFVKAFELIRKELGLILERDVLKTFIFFLGSFSGTRLN